MENVHSTQHVHDDSTAQNGHRSSFFSQFGKASFVILTGSVVFGAGFYSGRYTETLKNVLPSVSHIYDEGGDAKETSNKKTINEQRIRQNDEQAQIPTPTHSNLENTQTIRINAEGQTYSLQAPEGWSLNIDVQNYTTTSKIQKDKYALIIRTNMATEGVPCGFLDAPVEPSDMFPDVTGFWHDTYTEFSGVDGTLFRRVNITANPSAEKSFFAVCKKSGEGWFQPTEFGFITYEIPYASDAENEYSSVLTTLDAMVASLIVAL